MVLPLMIDPVQAANERITHSFILSATTNVVGLISFRNDQVRILDLIVQPADQGL